MIEEEIIEKRNDSLGGEKHSHLSFGMLCFNHISGGSPYLYGTSIKHNGKNTTCIEKKYL